MKTQRMTIDFDEILYRDIKKYCGENNITCKNLVQVSIRDFLEKHMVPSDAESLFAMIKRHIPILDVVSLYVKDLVPCDKFYKGTCPLRDCEKDCLFAVSPIKDIWYCFGCKFGGDHISLVAQIENISQYKAAEKLIETFKKK